jgi:metal transporter CNNM
MAKLLDKFLGEERMTILSKQEISEIIKSHEDSDESDIDDDEESILLGALSFSEKKVKAIMTPKNVVYSLEENELLDERKLVEIKETGFSRIPVFHEKDDEIVGVLNVKSLINLEEGKKVYDIHFRNKIFKVNEDEKLDELLNKFILKKSHIAYVTNIHDTFLGIVTMEDLIEEIIQKEIMDETDNFKDMREESKKIIN